MYFDPIFLLFSLCFSLSSVEKKKGAFVWEKGFGVGSDFMSRSSDLDVVFGSSLKLRFSVSSSSTALCMQQSIFCALQKRTLLFSPFFSMRLRPKRWNFFLKPLWVFSMYMSKDFSVCIYLYFLTFFWSVFTICWLIWYIFVLFSAVWFVLFAHFFLKPFCGFFVDVVWFFCLYFLMTFLWILEVLMVDLKFFCYFCGFCFAGLVLE